jgi:hypothetical protein
LLVFKVVAPCCLRCMQLYTRYSGFEVFGA